MRVCARGRLYIGIHTSMERLGDRPRYRVMYVCVFVFVEMVASRRVLGYIHADMSVATILVYMQGEGRNRPTTACKRNHGCRPCGQMYIHRRVHSDVVTCCLQRQVVVVIQQQQLKQQQQQLKQQQQLIVSVLCVRCACVVLYM